MTSASAPAFVEAMPAVARGTRVVAFDADGCLWSGDVAEDFARWLFKRGKQSDALWGAYEKQNAQDPIEACTFMLKFYEGLSLADFTQEVSAFWQSSPRPWNAPVIAALRCLHDKGYRVWVVSGTASLVLAPVLRELPVERVYGVTCGVGADFTLTGKPTGIVTAGMGKAAILKAQGQERVAFAVGNSILDIEMLKLAEVPWAFRPDARLREQAKQHGWNIVD